MLVIPAIDIADGKCVRMKQGSFNDTKVYSDAPEKVASNFAALGIERIHVIDLDAVRETGTNYDCIARIRDSFNGQIEVGGGIRTMDTARKLVDLGIDYMVLGTILVNNPQSIIEWCLELGAFFIAGIDCRDGLVRTNGWQDSTSVKPEDLAIKSAKLGIGEVVYTDIARDGTMSGLKIETGEKIARASNLQVYISGGVGSMDDIQFLADKKPAGIGGVVIGKAYYEGLIDLPKAMEILS